MAKGSSSHFFSIPKHNEHEKLSSLNKITQNRRRNCEVLLTGFCYEGAGVGVESAEKADEVFSVENRNEDNED